MAVFSVHGSVVRCAVLKVVTSAGRSNVVGASPRPSGLIGVRAVSAECSWAFAAEKLT